MSYFGQWFGDYSGDWFGLEDDEDENAGFRGLWIVGRGAYDTLEETRRKLRRALEQAFIEPDKPEAAEFIAAMAPAMPEPVQKKIADAKPVKAVPAINWCAVRDDMSALAMAAERFTEALNDNDEDDDLMAILMAA